MEDDPAVDGKRLRGISLPVRSHGPAFEKRETVRVEERSTVSGQMHRLVLNSGVNCSKRREKAAPGVMSALQDFLTMLVGPFARKIAQSRNCVILIVKQITKQQ